MRLRARIEAEWDADPKYYPDPSPEIVIESATQSLMAEPLLLFEIADPASIKVGVERVKED